MENRFNERAIVSIIIPCYNYAHFLSEALDSVLSQTYTEWECIIINDGSPDNTEEIALSYCKRDIRFKYFYKENGGHGSARNYGIKNSTGKYIMPLDADDKIESTYISKAVEEIESDTNIKLVTGQVQYFGDLNEKVIVPVYNLRSYLTVNYISISSLFRRSDFDKAKGFDETMLAFEDWDLFIKILKWGGKVSQLPNTGLFYRRKNGSMFHTVSNDKSKALKDLYQVYHNNKDVYLDYFDNPIYLIQENEKMNKVINAYQQTITYRIGAYIGQIKKYFKKSK